MSENGSEPVVSFNEAPCLISIKNPAGWMLVLRANDIAGLADQINDAWDGHVGKRTDLTNLALFSFNPAIIRDMQEGRTAEEAMGYEPDELATAAYNALAQGAKRQPVSAPAGNGARSGGGAGERKTFRVGDDGYTERDLPNWFLDKISRRNTCPNCDGAEFEDSRGNTQKFPDFKCTNRDACHTGKGGYAWGVYEPDNTRSSAGSRTR